MSHQLPTPYQSQIHIRHYARWNDELERRETWEETVGRYITQISKQVSKMGSELSLKETAEIRDAIETLRVMPSMRALMTSGPALEKDNVAGYNCAYVAVDHPRAFDETLYILCCGTGVGFSVERQHTNKLPEVPDELYPTETTIVVDDSKIGWAKSYRELLHLLWAGQIPKWDTSKVRKAGERLKTFGGRASGPGPLEDLFRFTVQVFQGAVGRKLTSTEAHELMCKIGDIVVVGGVRRSALISLYNPSDDRMANVKSGEYWRGSPHLRLANNSAVWTDKPTVERFLEQQWLPLIKGKSGEPGIINRSALQSKAKENGRRDHEQDFGVNPCGEIILRSCQFCNLSEVVARPEDDFDDLINKVRLATILGTIQGTFTGFRYLRKKWQKNCEEERLLGVSLTGVVDNPILNGSLGDAELRGTLEALKHVAIDTNAEWSERLGINQSVAITCNKPSGTVSQLVHSGSGINEWWSEYYIRRNRGNKVDPASQVLYASGVPCEDDMMDPDNAWVFSWPINAPEGALTRDEMPALKKLDLWLAYAEAWCEHNPSVTVNVKESEWLAVGAFVHEHFDRMAGVAFLPFDDHVYHQAPYEAITKDAYDELVAQMPESIDWTLLGDLETEDRTENARELACSAGSCEIDLPSANGSEKDLTIAA
jgi:ribonucleoside-triphosphate reductase